jgi:hypothetical protein
MFGRTSNAYAPIAIAAKIEAAARRCDGEHRGSHANETRARDPPCCEPPSALAYIDQSAHREISSPTVNVRVASARTGEYAARTPPSALAGGK